MIFKEKSKEKVLYTKNERTIYDEYDRGYVLNWLVMKSNEFEMEPLILSLKPVRLINILIHLSQIHLFIA